MWAILGVWLVTVLLDTQHNYWVNPGVSAVDLTRQSASLGLIALGAAIVILAGGIDLSTGSVMAFGSTICATILLLLAPEQMLSGEPLPFSAIALSIAGTIFVGFLIGSLHAWLITVIGLPPFVATLGTLVGLRSLGRAICEGATAATLGGMSTQINLSDPNFRYLASSVWIPAVLLLVIAAGIWLLLSKTITGRHLYALGGNEQAARLCGIRTDGLKWLAYSLSAMLSALAGMLAMLDTGVANPQVLGRGAELNAIAAAVVGGCSLQGGVGSVPGTLLGALFLRSVIDSVAKIIKTGADVYEGLIVGVLVVGAVTFARSQSSQGPQKLLAGLLGWVAILNLTLLCMALSALIGTKLLAGRTQLEAGPLALLGGLAAFSLMLLMRQSLPLKAKRIAWIGWGAGLVVLFFVADRTYPAWQQTRAVQQVQRLGGRVSQDDQGLIVDLQGSPITNADLKPLVARLRFFDQIAELHLNDTPITDAGLTALEPLQAQLKQLTVGPPITQSALTRLQRRLSSLDVEYESSSSPMP